MKRFTLILISIMVLVAMMVTPVTATGGSPAASLSSYVTTGAPGETVSVTLNLSGFADATSMGLQITTADGLKLNSESCAWLKSGMLVNFSGNSGVWGVGAATDINGSVATLVFTVPTPAAGQTNMDYSFTCSVQAMNNADVIGSVSASGVIRVSNPATALTLDNSSLSLDMNGSASAVLTATVTPANTSDALVWASSDTSVATVSNGTVTAKKAGTATITVTAGSLSASCTVTVTCSHDLKEYPYQAPTCQAAGNNLYYTCNACGIVLDANKAATTVDAQILAKVDHAGGTATCAAKAVCSMCQQPYGETLPHTYATAWSYDENGHWNICTSCNTAKNNAAAHTLVWITDKAPTEDATGLKHQQCTCGYKTSENTVIEKLPHSHTGIEYHAAVAATCTTTGNVEYWTCASDKCDGKYYSDENCYNLLTTIETPINEDNHLASELRNVSTANCYQDGYTGDTCCKACGDVLTAGVVVPTSGKHVAGTKWYSDAENHWHVCTTSGCGAVVDQQKHTFTWKTDKAATEDETGLKHEECACGYKRNENTVIPKLDHVHVGIQHHAAVPATCVKTGTVEYWTCSSTKCTDKYYGDANCQLLLSTIVEEINATNHTGDTELKDQLDATCSENGYSGDTWCTSCKTMIQKGEAIPATGVHTPKDTYEMDEKVHWQLCVHCDAIVGGVKVEHTYTWKIDKAATESATGLKHQECTACGHVINKDTVIEKLKHNPVRVDGQLPTCEEEGVAEHFFCKNCGSYYTSVDGKVGKWTKKDALVLPASGHVMGTEWLSDEDNHWHACSCGEKEDEAAHEFQLVGALEATETEEGYTGDEVCTVCEYVKTKGEVIPCVAVEETEAPTVEETVPAPTEAPAEAKKGGFPIVWILLLLAVIVVVVLLILKRRKGQA